MALAIVELIKARGVRRALPAALLTMLALACLSLHADQWTQSQGTELSVAIVQGNVPQDQKFVPEHREEIVRRYIA